MRLPVVQGPHGEQEAWRHDDRAALTDYVAKDRDASADRRVHTLLAARADQTEQLEDGRLVVVDVVLPVLGEQFVLEALPPDMHVRGERQDGHLGGRHSTLTGDRLVGLEWFQRKLGVELWNKNTFIIKCNASLIPYFCYCLGCS